MEDTFIAEWIAKNWPSASDPERILISKALKDGYIEATKDCAGFLISNKSSSANSNPGGFHEKHI